MAWPEPFNRVKRCRHGTLLYNVHDRYIGRSLDAYGEFSEGEVELFRQVVRPGNLVVEVGANIGAHTVFFARTVGPQGCVWAYEPQRIVFQALCANASLNSLTNVQAVPAAVGAAAGEILVPALDYTRENNFGGLGLGSFQSGERVPVIPLDSQGLPGCDFLKIDVEGMEQDVIAGAAELITRHRPLLYVENDRPEKADALIAAIDRLGYVLYWHTPPLFNPANHDGNPANLFGNVASINMFCLPREKPHQVSGLRAVELPRAVEGP
jgi:FkbM family methyltransferase